jgi:NADH:ubiquinone oxidoreductase subunit K
MITNNIYFSTFLFIIGLIGVLINRKNIILILISIEILTLAICLNYSIFSIYLDDIAGHIFVRATFNIVFACLDFDQNSQYLLTRQFTS